MVTVLTLQIETFISLCQVFQFLQKRRLLYKYDPNEADIVPRVENLTTYKSQFSKSILKYEKPILQSKASAQNSLSFGKSSHADFHSL